MRPCAFAVPSSYLQVYSWGGLSAGLTEPLPVTEGLLGVPSYINIWVGYFSAFSSKATLNFPQLGEVVFSYYWDQWVKAYVFNGGFGKHGIGVIIRIERSKLHSLFSVLQIQINGLNETLQFIKCGRNIQINKSLSWHTAFL